MKLKFLSATFFTLALASAQAATFTVSTTSDVGPGSLRQAILDANGTAGEDTIVFTTNGTINLASPLPTVTGNTTITGPGTNSLIISGNNSVQIFNLNAGTTNTLAGLTIANGLAIGYANGAGIANAGELTILDCALLNNTNLYGWGGAIFNSGDLAMTDSTLSGNQTIGENGLSSGGGGGAGMGGAIFTMSGSCNLSGCTLAKNCATGGNGGSYPCNGPNAGRGGGINGGGPGHGLQNNAGSGGFGGGGGGHNVFYTGGNGGFGGGGGGGGGGGQGGIGGGAGSGSDGEGGGGGGGAGIGGGIFVQSGTVSMVDCSFSNNQAVGGLGGPSPCGGPGGAGSGIGRDIYNLAGTFLPILTATTPGGGTVVVDPPAPPYLNSSLATVTATPAAGWTFLQWLGDASGTNPQVTIHMTRSKTVEAVFGTSLSYSSGMSVSPQAVLYPFGTVAKLTANPAPGDYFIAWLGDATGTNNPLSFAITVESPNISCQFGQLGLGETSLTFVESGAGHVVLFPPRYLYYIYETAGLIPVPDSGQDFLGWTGDATGIQNPLLVSMNQSRIITAIFTKRPSLRVSTPIDGLVEDGFRLSLIGEFGTDYAILGSTNLDDWSAVGTVTNTYGTVQLTDPAATNLPYRFYRAMNQ